MLAVYPVHFVSLNSSAAYRRCLVEGKVTLVRFLQVKMKMCNEIEQDDEGKDKCAHYKTTRMEQGHARKRMMHCDRVL